MQKIAVQVESAVRLGDALGKSDAEIRAEVTALVGHLPVSELEAVRQCISDANARDQI